ncbi:MocR-like pyridoxine biosynthesis transcription factor PdxR [Bhargavaea cecembensis]|uniref:MocR-like pyridoxine biosynthesis transcription factor PdxR n=1 Tax=Bhargavaea cecembensis TaxID=394098 RepID=UPI00058B75DB|nr:PLP-dependent aminotransferase family protein [Bhargavaea cecembensis]
MKDIIFAFHEGSPKYKQVYERFKRWIEQGELLPGEQLPSIRRLADSLQVSRNTTLMAYEQLMAEGYIQGESRRGYFVNRLEPLFLHGTTSRSVRPAPPEPSVTVDFRAGAVDQAHFPLKAWRRIFNQVLAEKESFLYGDPFGERRLREQIASYLFQSRGVSADADAIVIGSSTQQMLLQLGHVLREDHSSVAVEDPGYDGAWEAFRFHSFGIRTLPVRETGIDLSHLGGTDAGVAYVTPSHQSPLGVSMTIQQRQALLNWAASREGYVIEDDYDSEFRYTGRPFPALAATDSSRVVYLGNFSKSFLPGIRLGYMVLPPGLLDRYHARFQNFETTASLPNQLAMARFIEDGEWSRHIKRMRLVYKRKMTRLISVLDRLFGGQVTMVGKESGLFLLIKVHLPYTEEELIRRASSQGVRVYPSSTYFIRNHPDRPMIKLGFSSLSAEEIELGAELLKKAWF